MSETINSTPTPRYRPVNFGVTRVSVREGAPGVRYVQAELPLGAFARRLSDFLVHWAEAEPDRTFMARRAQLGDGRTGDWQRISYAQALDSARRIGQALLDRKLSPERPVVILSENTLEHALMSLGCIYAGVPYCPVSPAYATVSQDYEAQLPVAEGIRLLGLTLSGILREAAGDTEPVQPSLPL